MLRGSTGLIHCAQPLCSDIPMGGMGRLDVGYRAGFYSLWLTADGGGGRLDLAPFEDDDGPVTGIRGGLTFFQTGVGAALHPVDLGRVDPHLGLAFGFSRVEQRFRSDQRDFELVDRRGAVMPSLGIDVYLARRVAVGPRADLVVPFGGSRCVRQGNTQECLSTADIVDADDTATARARRRTFPRPWSATVQVTLYLL